MHTAAQASTPSQQIVDIGINHAQLQTHLTRCGYWGDETKRERNAYVLSPAAYLVSSAQQNQLRRLASATYRALMAVERSLSKAAKKQQLSHREARLLQVARSSTRGLLRPGDGGDLDIPPVLKIDLLQDPTGHYFIAEVDACNPRGFGYAALLESTLPHNARVGRYAGVQGLAKLFGDRAHGIDTEWRILMPDHERYYESSYSALCMGLAQHGVRARVTRSKTMDVASEIKDNTLHVLAIPEMNTCPSVRSQLLAAYRDGRVRALYPPKHYLGAKTLLPFLAEEQGMDEFVPHTTLASRKNRSLRGVDTKRPLVLKAAMSSGSKGVIFSRDQSWGETLSRALRLKTPAWIAQEEVRQQPLHVPVYDAHGNRTSGAYYLRVVAFVTATGILDLVVTGRPDRLAHGAADCIQLPSVLG